MKTSRLVPVLVLALVLTACGQQPATPIATAAPPTSPPTSSLPTLAIPVDVATDVPITDTPAPSPTPPGFAELIAAARQEGALNVVALPHNWLNYGKIISTFAEKYGLQVNELEPNAGSSRELDLIRKGKTAPAASPDVIDVGLPFALQAMNDHLLAPYKVATWDSIPAAAKDAEGYWVGDYYGLIVFEVNSRFVSEAPADWPDLLNADYNLALGGYPAHSYMGMVTVYSASLANGGSLDDTIPGLRYFQQINRDGHLSANFNADRASVTSGETPLLLTWDYLALADKRSNSDIEVVVPKSGLIAGLYAQGISAYAPHPNAARLWMEFLYSDEGQLLFLEGLGHPVRFADLHERGIIPDSVLLDLLPAEPYLQALFPTAEQMSAADKSILGSWRSYVR